MAISYKDKLLMMMAHTTSRLGLLNLYRGLRGLTQTRAPILLYHRVGDSKYPWSFEQTKVSVFEAEMKYLFNNYEVVDLQRIVECLQKEQPLPKKTVAITFDDGYKDNYLNAYPILRKYHLPATIFISSGHIDSGKLFWWDKLRYIIWHLPVNEINMKGIGSFYLNSSASRRETAIEIEYKLKQKSEKNKNEVILALLELSELKIPSSLGKDFILSWDEIREMKDNGISFGAHTVTHPVMTRIPLDKVKWEIEESKKRIETELQQPINAFSYPNGHPEDYNSEIKGLIKNAGFACAFTAFPPKPVVASDDLFQLSRIGLGSDFDFFKFSLELLPDVWSRLGSN